MDARVMFQKMTFDKSAGEVNFARLRCQTCLYADVIKFEDIEVRICTVICPAFYTVSHISQRDAVNFAQCFFFGQCTRGHAEDIAQQSPKFITSAAAVEPFAVIQPVETWKTADDQPVRYPWQKINKRMLFYHGCSFKWSAVLDLYHCTTVPSVVGVYLRVYIASGSWLGK